MQFNIDEILDNFNSSPSVIDVSSESREEFIVEPGNIEALDKRFRVVSPNSDAMSAFVGAVAATLFPSSSVLTSRKKSLTPLGHKLKDS